MGVSRRFWKSGPRRTNNFPWIYHLLHCSNYSETGNLPYRSGLYTLSFAQSHITNHSIGFGSFPNHFVASLFPSPFAERSLRAHRCSMPALLLLDFNSRHTILLKHNQSSTQLTTPYPRRRIICGSYNGSGVTVALIRRPKYSISTASPSPMLLGR